MASKKKGGRKPRATTRGKTKAGARKASAGKTKAATRKAKAATRKPKAATPKAKASARKAKRAPVRKRAPVAVAKSQSPTAERPSGPVILDEVIEESLLDVSTVLRIKDGVARTQLDVDEDELKQFPDPSLVVEAQTSKPREDDTDPSISHLPDLFAAEARRQKARLGDTPADAGQKPQDSSLFGSLGAPDDDDDPDED